ncbi:hypothetical protein [Rhizobium sp. L245/93]|uniref:hypothetical protein n=1 Tax=Rhizobium sp. L245/93 TaxID=2819998 RepID=UPI001ADC7FE2|nr:hypothetical protein [Rhizobium sp. L245/93]MBO9170455.1 hypothetical protein [Rhizobium sp. L245/93]
MKQILSARGLRFRDDVPSAVLSSFSLGVHINAILFLLCWVFAAPRHPLLLACILIAVNFSITLIGWFLSRSRSLLLEGPTLLMLVAGTMIGLFAAFRFPSSLDSVQVLQVQNFLLGRTGGQMIGEDAASRLASFLFGGLEVPTQSGFAGLMLIPSLLQMQMPVATIAAGNKVLLLVLAALVSLYVARQLKIKFLLLGAALILANMVFSQFGLYGLFSTGKDSIFAMTMALASLSAVIDAEDDTNEPGLYLSAGILLGAIAVPYLIVFWSIYIVLSGGRLLRQAGRLAAWSTYPLILSIIGVRAAFAEPGAMHAGLLSALMIGALLVWILNFSASRWRGFGIEFSPRVWTAMAFLPSLSLLGIWLAMPVIGRIIIGYDKAGPIIEAPAPLDGKMSAWDFLLSMYPTNNHWISIAAVLLSGAAPILSVRFRSPFYIALFAFVPATTLFAVLNVKFNIPILPHFNLWDITRDAVQWCLGVFGFILVLCGVRAVLARLGLADEKAVLAAGALFVTGLFFNLGEYRRELGRPPTITPSGGFADPISALAMDFTWREGRNSAVYVSKDSDFARDFYSYQMFGPAQLRYFDPSETSDASEQLYFASSGDVGTILKTAAARKSSGFVKPISEEGYVIKILNDGKAELDESAIPPLAAKISGAFGVEISLGRQFRWVQQQSELTLISRQNADRQLCFNLEFVNAWTDKNLRINIKGNALDMEFAVPPDANFSSPAKEDVCVLADENGVAKVNLSASTPARQFPGDVRNIAYGIIWPVN